jgi:hypothetical protein
MMRKSVQIARLLVGAALLGGVAMPTWAVDGVVLIDQNKAMAGNITPGDTPGFPVTISLPGSYRLASNLTVPNSNTNAIVIAADHVTLDLNGFAILGPTDCSGGLNPCANAVSDPNVGSGFGISTANLFVGGLQFNITIRNGTIQGMGNRGIILAGDSHLVEYMHVRSNGWGGIDIGEGPDRGGSIVQHNTAERNGGFGISNVEGLVSHNTVDANISGIFVDTGSASYNFVTRNATFPNDSYGLLLGPGSSYIGNVLNRNSRNVGGGVNLGQNLCDFAACPGGHL